MTTVSVDAATQIEDVIQALTGDPFYDWQRDYTRDLVAQRVPPRLVDLPTASGKTTIALIHFLGGLLDVFDRPVRRVWLAEPTRLLVDIMSARFTALVETLMSSDEPAIVDFREQAGLTADKVSGVHAYYGGSSAEQRAMPRVDAHALIITTHQQIGLVLHTHAPRQWAPIVTGASLIIDEAHTNPNIGGATESLLDQPKAFGGFGNKLRAYLTEMTATPTHTHSVVFRRTRDELAEADTALRTRMTATASVKLIDKAGVYKDKALSKQRRFRKFADTTCESLRASFRPEAGHSLALVVVNTTGLAKSVYAAVRRAWRGAADVRLLIGRAREAEKTSERELLTSITNGLAVGPKPTIYVATQTIESGIDCSADVLITECPDAAALVQRYARCNRDGKSKNARVVIVRFSPHVYTKELIDATWTALKKREKLHKRRLTVRHLDDLLVDPALRRSETVVCKMTPARFDVLGQNGGNRRFAMDPAAFTEQPSRAEVTIVFRQIEEDLVSVSDEWRAQAYRQFSRPAFGEQVTVPLDDVAEWLGVRPALAFDRVERRCNLVHGRNLRPFQEIVVPTTYGGLTRTGAWDTDAGEEVVDISFREQLRLRGWTSIPANEAPDARARRLLHISASCRRIGLGAAERRPTPPNPDDYDNTLEFGRALAQWVNARGVDGVEITPDSVIEEDGVIYVGRGKNGFSPPYLESGDVSPVVPALLHAHNAGVAARAARVAGRLQLDAALGSGHVDAIMIGAGLGDIGKAYDAHQRYFYGRAVASGEPLLAKSLPSPLNDKERRAAAQYPLNERHEVVSVTCADSPGFDVMTDGLTAAQRLLVEHLIVSHHGHGFPAIPGSNRATPPPPPEKFQIAVTLGSRSAVLECDPNYSPREQEKLALARFDRLVDIYGRYTLALLELIVHSADAEQSRAEQEATT